MDNATIPLFLCAVMFSQVAIGVLCAFAGYLAGEREAKKEIGKK